MILYIPPTPPNYDKIIEEELEKIRDYSWMQDSKERALLHKENPLYKNPAYNNAVVESFEASVKARLLAAKDDYIRELNDYNNKLKQLLSDTDSEISRNKKEAVAIEEDFETVKHFYDDFQGLVRNKFKYIYNLVKQVLNSDQNQEDK